MRNKWHIPIRVKIISLITAALCLSLLSYLYAGTSLFTQDKISYIYDHNLAQVRAAVSRVENRLNSVKIFAAAFDQVRAVVADENQLREFFASSAGILGINGILLVQDGSIIRQAGQLPPGHTELLTGESKGLRKLSDGTITFAGPVAGPVSGKSFIAFLPDLKSLLATEAEDYQLQLVDLSGQSISSSSRLNEPVPDSLVEGFAGRIVSDRFPSGIRNLIFGETRFIAAYEQLDLAGVLAIGMIPESTAFAASRTLVGRSLILGFSILMLALGLALFLARGLTTRLALLWDATQKVGAGDFSVRVDHSEKMEDEVSGLAKSFNTMADRIDDLMKQTAEKARMEKELETAQAVQEHFLPSKAYASPRVNVAGTSIPASECAGDWWQYRELGRHLVVAIGDVTGHGVSAALVTAAAHAAFTLAARRLASVADSSEIIRVILSDLNEAVDAAATAGTTMTFVISVLDMETGQMKWINASHCCPYVYRAKPGSRSVDEQLSILTTAKCAPLGSRDFVPTEPETFQLQPGDHVFWFTDGLFDSRLTDYERMSRLKLARFLIETAGRSEGDSKAVSDAVIRHAVDFFGGKTCISDDITVVTASMLPAFAAKKNAA